MIDITLPDSRILQYPEKVTGTEIAENISKSLSKKAVAIYVNDTLCDLSTKIEGDAKIKIVTDEDPEALEIIRHDAAHVLAQALKTLYPDCQITIGPVIENGFYYDFLPTKPFSIEELGALEKEMHRIASANIPIVREVWDRNEAIKFFRSIGENFKAEIIASIPEGESITLYKQGEFLDLCRGPHAPSTKFVKHFKLTKVAGAYWRGDSNNIMLQRIYGTAWLTQQDLDNHMRMIEEAERRDHRKIGKQLNLFHMQEEAPGMVFWHHNGWTIYRLIQQYIRDKISASGYIEVNTPILVDRSLWEKSGHWEKFGENMFTIQDEDKTMAMKPMNCPCHIEIFKTEIRSYRDLPIRMAEFGCCHRNEASGALHGIMRVRNFVQDDAHIFCTEEQIKSETVDFTKLLKQVYKDFGFNEITLKLSDRPDKRAGNDETWDKAETALKDAVAEAGMTYILNKGEGAFYGPKLEFCLKDAIGREWQCGTFQLDFIMPERLKAYYISEDGSKKHPVLLHRAICGSLERFVGILTEHYEGKFPLWLAPTQVAILTITSSADDYSEEIKKYLDDRRYRSVLDNSNEKINYKIRKYSMLKVPILMILGVDEKQNRSVSIRTFGSNEQMHFNSIEDFEKHLQNRIQSRS